MFFNGMPEQDGESFKRRLQGDVQRSLRPRGRRQRLGDGPQQRGQLRPDRVQPGHDALHQRQRDRLVRRPEGGRQERRRDQGVPAVVRHLGPLRLRRRRRLQRARRLHRPLPGDPRRRGRGGRRPGVGHLVAPLVGQPQRQRPARSAAPRRAASRSATPASGSATTRRSRRTAASASSRTSSATTSACRTTTTPTAARTAPASGT